MNTEHQPHTSEYWIERLVSRLECDEPNKKINFVGRTRKEQQQIEAKVKKLGSLWPDLTEMMGPYIPRWKWHAKRELLEAARTLLTEK